MPDSSHEVTASRGWFTRFLDVVERMGNLLPHPVTLFALFALGVIWVFVLGLPVGPAAPTYYTP